VLLAIALGGATFYAVDVMLPAACRPWATAARSLMLSPPARGAGGT